ncbi:Scramblase-domain-containing protein [Obba rivulosa]|uniref:Phospholipid scramblase n=1 Tax=Obba rivulosa TaxID=1052685 RepID=A0A8E2DK07_9APHY|nr:Scramblase-domain-containing protein [Obba rivulosa]
MLAQLSGKGLRQPLTSSLKTWPSLSCRTYAWSRYPDRSGLRSSRHEARRTSPFPRPKGPEPFAEPGQGFNPFAFNDPRPSVESSPLWEASRRPATSDPHEGLQNLLMYNDQLIVTRQLEMLNVFLGFEQANKYVIENEAGETLGFIAEEQHGLLSVFARQVFRTHRPFRAVVMDSAGTPVLWLRRPFAFINSRMYVQRLKDFGEYTPEGEPILDTFAEVQQRWHLWRRRYELFLRDGHRRVLSTTADPQPEPDLELYKQFAVVDEGFLAWHFTLRGKQGEELATINRAFRGIGRELFTDTGRYYVRFGPTPLDPMLPFVPDVPVIERPLTLEERALAIATAVNIDFDYFSRHSSGHGGGFIGFDE